MYTKRILIAIIAILALGAAYYAISPTFRQVRVDEASPEIPSARTEEAAEEVSISAPITGTAGHPASGSARVITTEENRFLRYENFKTLNGPDLYVYLAADLQAKDFVNLGTLKATEGNVNYEIPAGTDTGKYRYALVWCKAFGVLFNSAELSQ